MLRTLAIPIAILTAVAVTVVFVLARRRRAAAREPAESRPGRSTRVATRPAATHPDEAPVPQSTPSPQSAQPSNPVAAAAATTTTVAAPARSDVHAETELVSDFQAAATGTDPDFATSEGPDFSESGRHHRVVTSALDGFDLDSEVDGPS